MNLIGPMLAVRFSATIPAVLAVLVGCESQDTQTPEFNGDRAYDYLKKQVAFGPRVPGTEASKECRKYYYDHFKTANMTIDSQSFQFFDPYSAAEITLVNIIAGFTAHTDSEDRILLMAHYDSRPRTDNPSRPGGNDEPISGANDGASGVAVLMELANLFVAVPPPCNIDLVLVDGEDWGKVSDHEYYMLGSREFGRRGIRGKYRFGIVLDMVGDADQQFFREKYSEANYPELNDMIWRTADDLGIDTFIDSVKYAVRDDHLSLISSGVPAVDVIDFDYPHWHSDRDTADKCSARSLANIGRVVAEIIYNPWRWPPK